MVNERMSPQMSYWSFPMDLDHLDAAPGYLRAIETIPGRVLLTSTRVADQPVTIIGAAVDPKDMDAVSRRIAAAGMSSVDGAKYRVARRAQLRSQAALAGRKLPAEYRECVRRQFAQGERESSAIVRSHQGHLTSH